MKRWFITGAVSLFFAANGWAQSTQSTQPPPGTISSRPTNGTYGQATPGYLPNTNYSSNNSLMLTNGAGGTFTVEQLASQLQSLRATVEQTLPMLTAFNERYSASQPGSTLGRAVQNIFSGNKNQGSGSTAGQEITNVLAALGALVSTNNQSLSPTTLKDLSTLQKDLQPVEQALQNLSFTATSTNGVYTTPGSMPSPTGR